MANFMAIFCAYFAGKCWALNWFEEHFLLLPFFSNDAIVTATDWNTNYMYFSVAFEKTGISQENLSNLFGLLCLFVVAWLQWFFWQETWYILDVVLIIVAVTKFHDKFVNLWQVNSPNSQDKFQICRYVFGTISSEICSILCIFVNFAGFRRFAWNSQLLNHKKYQKSCLDDRLKMMELVLTILSNLLYQLGWKDYLET